MCEGCADLLLPEASIDYAATQVVHPLPLNYIIQHQLSAHRRPQLTWEQKNKLIIHHTNFLRPETNIAPLQESLGSYLEEGPVFPGLPTGSRQRWVSWRQSWCHFSEALWPVPVSSGDSHPCNDIIEMRIQTTILVTKGTPDFKLPKSSTDDPRIPFLWWDVTWQSHLRNLAHRDDVVICSAQQLVPMLNLFQCHTLE